MRANLSILAKEGWLYFGIAIFFWVSSLVFNFYPWVFFFFVILVIVFYKNPERVPLEHDKLALIAPIDGAIVKISKGKDLQNQDSVVVSIRNQPYQTSLLRVPTFCKIKEIKSVSGLSLSHEEKHSYLLNSKKFIHFQAEFHSFWMGVKNGAWSNKIAIYQTNKELWQGERVGFALGAEVTLYLPIDTRIRVNEKDKVFAGESVLGYLEGK